MMADCLRWPLTILFFLAATGLLRGQQVNFSKELRFAEYLENKDAAAEAIDVLQHIDTAALTRQQKDSLFYMLGWDDYATKKLQASVVNLMNVSPASARYDKSRFFSAYGETFLGHTDSAAVILQQLSLPDSVLRERWKDGMTQGLPIGLLLAPGVRQRLFPIYTRTCLD
jgi:hypothetical protein